MDFNDDQQQYLDPTDTTSRQLAAYQAQQQAQAIGPSFHLKMHLTTPIATLSAAVQPGLMMAASRRSSAIQGPLSFPGMINANSGMEVSTLSRRGSAQQQQQQQQPQDFTDITMAGLDSEPQSQYGDFQDAAFGGFADTSMGGMGPMPGMGAMQQSFGSAMTVDQAGFQLEDLDSPSPGMQSGQSMYGMGTPLSRGSTSSDMSKSRQGSTATSMPPPPMPRPSSTNTASSLSVTTVGSMGSAATTSTASTTPVSKSPVVGPFPEQPPASSQKPSSLSDPYSQSGFNFLELLQKVVSRPNPQVDIGAVDMSCSFVVTDARKYDNPIVYVSPTFEILTGYMKWEIRGRNCRFLQDPNGTVEKGQKRQFVDEQTVLYFKSQLERGREAQATLLNYRKNGVPFVNLLTMIPIEADGNKAAYFVGFQIDLVDHPDAIERRNADGSCNTNYRYQPSIPMFNMGSAPYGRRPLAQTFTNSHQNTTQLLRTGNPMIKGKQSQEYWDKALLENTDSVVFVLSLKGVIQYCSQSLKNVLGWHPDEWVNTNISKYCHPSDIVPFTRELRETSSEKTVDVIFRIRKRDAGYVWFESFGSLNAEPGKGKKCIFFSGHQIPVYHLPANLINISSVSDNELWYKISPTAILLNMSSKSKQLLDRDSTELVGTSLTDLVRADKVNDIRQILLKLRSATPDQPRLQEVHHDIQHKRGHYLQCLTTFYIGEEINEENPRPPTYFIAETKFLKSHGRSANAQRRQQEERMAARNPLAQTSAGMAAASAGDMALTVRSPMYLATQLPSGGGTFRYAPSSALALLGTDDDLFEQLKVTRSSSWQFELRNMQKENKKLAEQVTQLLAARKKRKRRRLDREKECANCHTKSTPEWRRGPSGNRDLCNSCGLRFAKTVPRQSRTVTSKSQTDAGDTPTTQGTLMQTTTPTQQPDSGSSSKEGTASREESASSTSATPASASEDTAT